MLSRGGKQCGGLYYTAVDRLRHGQHCAEEQDVLAVEEPLEIKLAHGTAANRQHYGLAVTMRTPGQDHDLVTGFLFTEGIIGRADQLQQVQHVGQALDPSAHDNIVLAELSPEVELDTTQFSRHFYTSSSCGVCGKAAIEMVRTVSMYYPRPGYPSVAPQLLGELPRRMRAAQGLFEHTGGIHAAGLFAADGELLLLREDVGRHNALDKLIGAALRQGVFPLRDHIVLVSGRLSFELIQKATMAGVAIIAAVGAPSSLAIELARESGMTVVGFLRDGRCNVYHDEQRLNWISSQEEAPDRVSLQYAEARLPLSAVAVGTN